MFTYCCYYSEQQKKFWNEMGNDGENFIILSTGMELEYTEILSSRRKSDWEDAKLVYASDQPPKIRHIWGPQELEQLDHYILSDEFLDDNDAFDRPLE